MSAGTVRSLPLGVVAGRTDSAAVPDTGSALTRREATLRATATACLVGIALVQAVELPVLLSRTGQLAALSIAASALCVALGVALAAAPAGASRPLWRVVAATGVLVLAGWAVPHAVAVPQDAGARGEWNAMPGALCAALAALSLLMSAASARPTARGLATALAVLIALGPGAGGLLVAVGPGPAGGEAALASDVHVHSATSGESDFQLRPVRNGSHYVTVVPAPPRSPAPAVALVVAAACLVVLGAVGSLRRRIAPPPAGRGPTPERRLA